MRAPRAADYRLLAQIRERSEKLTNETPESLIVVADELRSRLTLGEGSPLDQVSVIESFALATEALRRATGKVYYDVQLLGGLILATGGIAEMQTGEGKTVTCALPAVLYGLTGRGVHVSTTNAYLAARDQEELQPILELLGMSSGLIESNQEPSAKRAAYLADVTYGTGYEFGFDFLRDQLALRNRPELPLGTRFLSRLRGFPFRDVDLMQRELHFAIVDEADSVLIDEATTPLILSGTGGKRAPQPEVYRHAMIVANGLDEGADFETDWIQKSIELTERGFEKIHQSLTAPIQSRIQRPWSQYISQAIRARIMMRCDVDYVVDNDQIVIVDQHTGRLHDERKWRNGLHQAVEIREGVTLTDEREIEARITRQRYFQFYELVAGMTGTAAGNEAELLEFYQLPVVKVPRNKPSRRVQLPTRYFGNQVAKFKQVASDAITRANDGQPVLIGTRTIVQSQRIADILTQMDQEFTILNGTQDDTENQIIGVAGEPGRITIATNMAGRGTDIRLADESKLAGGLHVIVAEHHDSPRVDRQLIGRAARQNDPGSCQFYVAADDEIIDRFEPRLSRRMTSTADESGVCRSSFDREIRDLQATIEQTGFTSRRKMVAHDDWIETVQDAVARTA